jgi:hypothetical protein
MTTTDAISLETVPLTELRALRSAARRRYELARMRGRADDPNDQLRISELHARVDALTGELISRYCADLALVDSLLAPPYARCRAPESTSASDRAGER